MPGLAFAENARTHQRSKRKRNQTGGENRHDDGHGKFTEDATEQAGQEDKRDENRGERECHRQDGERNFTGSIVSGLYNRFAVFGATDDIFKKDDRIVDKETNGKRQRHQSQVVDRKIEHLNHRAGDQQ